MLGATDLVLYLIDYDYTTLIPDPAALPDGNGSEGVAVDGTMPGRAFQTATVVAAERDEGWRVWVPVQERANKLGVLAMSLPGYDEEVEAWCIEFGYATAYTLISGAHHTDRLHLLRRRQDMDLAAELQWSLLPPLSYASTGTTLAGLLEPAYEVGGDCFDYAANDDQLEIAIFDAMGHGLTSAILASLLVGDPQAHRAGYDIGHIATSVDAAARAFPSQPPNT